MLHLLRHGRTAANAGGLLLGRLDPSLDPVGEQQAAAAAAWLAGLVPAPARVVSSPLARCRQTAAAVAEVLGGAVEVDERWIELDYGELDGVALTDVPAETWRLWRTSAEFCPPGGECLSAMGRRVRAACDELAVEVGGGARVVVVSHVSPIKAAVAWALGAGDLLAWRLRLEPGSLTGVRVTPAGPSLVSFNLVPPAPAP